MTVYLYTYTIIYNADICTDIAVIDSSTTYAVVLYWGKICIPHLGTYLGIRYVCITCYVIRAVVW